jgi:Rrf2 family transcriptional regulator, nitric oxide-sensitive transcriptional repressor
MSSGTQIVGSERPLAPRAPGKTTATDFDQGIGPASLPIVQAGKERPAPPPASATTASRMRITLYTDYSLRVLIFLGLNRDRLSTIREIAERYQISRNHLMKVVNDLQQRGYIQTLRGKHGGLRLERDPESIQLGALVRATEPDHGLMECARPGQHCMIQPFCDLKYVLDEAMQAFMDVLDRYTLADLLRPRVCGGLRQLLGLDDTPPAKPLPANGACIASIDAG